MKPDWKDAPKWAKWLAMDQNRDWYWYEKEPTLGPYSWDAMQGKCIVATRNLPPWDNSLESRPVDTTRNVRDD